MFLAFAGCAGGWSGPDARMDAYRDIEVDMPDTDAVDNYVGSVTKQVSGRHIRVSSGVMTRRARHYYITSLRVTWRRPPKTVDSTPRVKE